MSGKIIFITLLMLAVAVAVPQRVWARGTCTCVSVYGVHSGGICTGGGNCICVGGDVATSDCCPNTGYACYLGANGCCSGRCGANYTCVENVDCSTFCVGKCGGHESALKSSEF
jgi:hypothetical protein